MSEDRRHLIVAHGQDMTRLVVSKLRSALEAHPGPVHTQILLYDGDGRTKLLCLPRHSVTPSGCLDQAITDAFASQGAHR